MEFIDTHTHIYLPEFDVDRDEAVERAVSSGVVKMLMPNIDTDSAVRMMAAAEKYKGICYPMMGLHPTSVREDYSMQLDELEDLWNRHNFIAVGEIGIDMYWDRTFLKEQVCSFRRQVEFALKKNLPVVIHSRESFSEVFKVLDEYAGEPLTGVFHAFTGTVNDAEKAIEMGFRLGIGGIVTFRNSGLDKIVKTAGPGNIIIETDSPYLAPVPYRGKRNESSYISLINNKIAEITGLTPEAVAGILYRNSVQLFNI